MPLPEAGAGELVRTIPVRQEWLDLHREEPIEPEIPIVDPHHHLWERPGSRYLAAEYMADANGNNVRATVFAECTSWYRQGGPDWMTPVGETEAVACLAAEASSGSCLVGAGIIAFADLGRGAAVAEVLDAHRQAGGDRFVGIRQTAVWDADPRMVMTPHAPKPAVPRGLMSDRLFLEGFDALRRAGVAFDTYLYHPQIGEAAELAKRFPDVPIILDHLGGPIRIGDEAAIKAAFDDWRSALGELRLLGNVRIKIGGLGMRLAGGRWNERERPPTSQDLAQAWKPWIDACVEAVGAERCMFESNFPVDKGSFGFTELWNAFKRATEKYSAAERSALFHDTAIGTYGLKIGSGGSR